MRRIDRRALVIATAGAVVFAAGFLLVFDRHGTWWHTVIIAVALGVVLYFVYAWELRRSRSHR